MRKELYLKLVEIRLPDSGDMVSFWMRTNMCLPKQKRASNMKYKQNKQPYNRFYYLMEQRKMINNKDTEKDNQYNKKEFIEMK